MPQKPETRFRMKVDKRLDELPNSWFESIQQKTIQGTPDKLGCVNGYFVALELKATATSYVSPLQLLKLDRIRAAGGYAALVHPDNLDEVMAKLFELANL